MKYLLSMIIAIMLLSCESNPVITISRIDTVYTSDTVYNIDTVIIEDKPDCNIDSGMIDWSNASLIAADGDLQWMIEIPWYNEFCNIKVYIKDLLYDSITNTNIVREVPYVIDNYAPFDNYTINSENGKIFVRIFKMRSYVQIMYKYKIIGVCP